MSDQTPVELSATPEELALLTQLRNSSDQLLHRIGLLRLEESRMLSQIQQSAQNVQGVLGQLAARLGIPEGVQWQLSPEGKVVLKSE